MPDHPVPESDWKWFGNAGHLIVGRSCQFHLCTQVGPWLVSTVGEYWPERTSREIHASVVDPAWFNENRSRRGDDFDRAYMERFGFEEIGCDRRFETMVFRAGKPCDRPGCGCGLPELMVAEEGERDFAPANDAGTAAKNHRAMCRKWAAIPLAATKSDEEDDDGA